MELIDYVSLYPSVAAVIIAFLAIVVTFTPPIKMRYKVSWLTVFAFIALSAIASMFWQTALLKRKQIQDSKKQKKDQKKSDSLLTHNILIGINSQLSPLKISLDNNGKIISSPKDKPVVFILRTYFSDLKQGEINDTAFYRIQFVNNSDYNAYNLNVNAYVLVNPNLIQKERLGIFKNYILPKKDTIEYRNYALIPHNTLASTTYFYIKGSYENEKIDIDYVLVCDFKNHTIEPCAASMHDEIVRKLRKNKPI